MIALLLEVFEDGVAMGSKVTVAIWFQNVFDKERARRQLGYSGPKIWVIPFWTKMDQYRLPQYRLVLLSLP